MVKLPTVAVIGVGLLTSVSIALVLTWLYTDGTLPQDFPFLGAKALLAYSGPEPRFEAFGYVFPPFVIYGVLLTGASPILFQAVTGGLVTSLVVRQISRIAIPRIWLIVWGILILLHPSFGLMLLYSPDWLTASLLLLGVMTLLLDLAQEREKRLLATGLSLVLLGLILAPLMLVRFEAWFLLPILAVTIIVTFYGSEPVGFQSSAVLVVLFMSLVAIGAFLYFNWITTEDALFFLNSPYGALQQARNPVFVQQERWELSWLTALRWLIPIVPMYLLTLIGVVLGATRHRLALALILLLPVIMLIISFWQGLFFPAASRFGVFLALLPVVWWHAPPTRILTRVLLTVALVFSLLYTGVLLQQNQFVPEETLVWRQLTAQPTPDSVEVQQLVQYSQAEQEMAELLENTLTGTQKVLADDTVGSPMLYRLRRSDRFILPYQYEFVPALQNPSIYTDFVLLSGAASPVANRDRVDAFWSQRGRIPNFQVVRENAYFRLLQRIPKAT
jgi:hypothetical protein